MLVNENDIHIASKDTSRANRNLEEARRNLNNAPRGPVYYSTDPEHDDQVIENRKRFEAELEEAKLNVIAAEQQEDLMISILAESSAIHQQLIDEADTKSWKTWAQDLGTLRMAELWFDIAVSSLFYSDFPAENSSFSSDFPGEVDDVYEAFQQVMNGIEDLNDLGALDADEARKIIDYATNVDMPDVLRTF